MVAEAPTGIALKWVQLHVQGELQHHPCTLVTSRSHCQVSDIKKTNLKLF